MAVIKGQNLRILVNNKCVANAVNATFHVALQMNDSSTKDSEGDWQENEVVGKSWDCQTDCLVALTDDGSNGELPQDLVSLIINATLVTIVFDQTAGTNNRVAQTSALKMTGNAYLNDLSINSANRENVKLNASFTGTGALALA